MKFWVLFLCLGLGLVADLWSAQKIYPTKNITQSELPAVNPVYLTPDFWVDKITEDGTVMTPTAISNFNHRIFRRGFLGKPLSFNQYSSVKLVNKYFKEDLAFMRTYIKYDVNGKRRRDPEFSEFLSKLINVNQFQNQETVRNRFAVVVKGSKLRTFPTDEVFARRPGDEEFDILVKSYLPVMSAVVILATSADGKWYYVESKFSRGWLKKETLELSTKEKVEEYYQFKGWLNPRERVVISAQAELYGADRKPINRLMPMGTVVELLDKPNSVNQKNDWVEIKFPNFNQPNKKYFVARQDLSATAEFLPMTRENVIRQAFKFIGTPYGWGGGEGATDCSLFFYYVFRSFGLAFPRSSSLQINSLFNQETSTDKLTKQLASVQAALSLIYISGPNHIMLYLGEHKGKPYFIHSTWSFKDRKNEFLISSVVVSDLSLGEDSLHGSLRQKAKKVGSFYDF